LGIDRGSIDRVAGSLNSTLVGTITGTISGAWNESDDRARRRNLVAEAMNFLYRWKEEAELRNY